MTKKRQRSLGAFSSFNHYLVRGRELPPDERLTLWGLQTVFLLSTVLGRGTGRAWEGTVNFPVHVQTPRSRGLVLFILQEEELVSELCLVISKQALFCLVSYTWASPRGRPLLRLTLYRP